MALGIVGIALVLLAGAAPPALAAPPGPPPLPAPIVVSSTSASTAPHRNAIGPAAATAPTYWVGTTADSSTATDCTTQGNTDCSLRQAATLSNANTGVTNTINFQIAASGVQTITLLTKIDITNPVVIDGYTEPGATPNTRAALASGTNATLTVRVDGNGGNFSGFYLFPGSDGSTIRGLSVTGFGIVGILVASTRDVITGDWLGVAPDGTAHGDSDGVGVLDTAATQNTIGGTAPADRNLISGNNIGVALQGGSGNTIEGNLIGTNTAGGRLGNANGVYVYSSAVNNTTGGTSAGQANLIAFNANQGVFVGSDATDTTTVGNTIRSNSIHDNGVGGIFLNGVGANDHCDADGGPNNFQNFPVLATATLAGGNTQISGTLDSTGGHTFHIDFYASPTNAGQGQTYLGSNDVTTDTTTCVASFSSVSFPAISGQPWITATATDTTTGDTSQFSNALETAAAIATNAGTPQSTPVGQPFGTALQAKVTDSTGAGVAGVSVTFTPNTGASGATGTFTGSTTVTTDANGVATAPTLTANLTPGAFTVTATASGVSGTATFNLTNNAATCIVNSLMDPTETGKTTLRGAVAILNGGGCTGDTVTFDPAVFPAGGPQTITLAGGSGTLALTFTTRPVTISGAGAGVIVDGGCITNAGGACVERGVTVFTVKRVVTATINALTIQHGFKAAGNGGGIFNDLGTLTVTNSTLAANATTGSGGGIANNGALTVTNSTFSANRADGLGGGISNENFRLLTVTNSTFSGNSAANGGGGIFTGGRATLTNTIVAASPTGGDLVAFAPSGGAFTGVNNLIDDAASAGGFTDGANGNIVGYPALLGPLGGYGSPTQTFALLPGSPAIDAGTPAGAPAGDQRGQGRVNAPDIGSFESQGFTLTPAAGSTPQSALVNTRFPQDLSVTVTATNPGEPVAGGVVTFTVTPVNGAAAALSAGTATISNSGTASVTATANGTSGTYTATAAATGATNATFTLTNLAPTITVAPATLPNGTAEQPYGPVTLTASGGTGSYTFAVTSGTLPSGLTLDANTGILGGTPTQAGSFPITVTATDANRFTGSRSYTLTIAAPAGITLTPTTLPGGTKSVAYPTQTLAAAGGVAPYSFAVTGGALPNGLMLTAAGVLSGTPTATGTFSFTVTATDANGFTGIQAYSVAIAAAPLVSIAIAPSGGGAPNVKVGQTVQFVATGTYADGSTQILPAAQVTWAGDNAPVAIVDGQGRVTGESPGPVHLTATDGNVSRTITVTVVGPTPLGIQPAPAPAARPSGATAPPAGAAGAPALPAPAPLPPGR